MSVIVKVIVNNGAMPSWTSGSISQKFIKEAKTKQEDIKECSKHHWRQLHTNKYTNIELQTQTYFIPCQHENGH